MKRYATTTYRTSDPIQNLRIRVQVCFTPRRGVSSKLSRFADVAAGFVTSDPACVQQTEYQGSHELLQLERESDESAMAGHSAADLTMPFGFHTSPRPPTVFSPQEDRINADDFSAPSSVIPPSSRDRRADSARDMEPDANQVYPDAGTNLARQSTMHASHPKATQPRHALHQVMTVRFHWQHKIFGPREAVYYRNLQSTSNQILESNAEHIRRLDQERRELGYDCYDGESIYTVVEGDDISAFPDYHAKLMTGSSESQPDFPMKAEDSRSTSPSKIPLRSSYNFITEQTSQTMYIRCAVDVDLVSLRQSKDENTSHLCHEETLCVIRYFSNGALEMRPGFSTSSKTPYKFTTKSGVYEYLIENLSESKLSDHQEAQLKTIQNIFSGTRKTQMAMIGTDFQMAEGMGRNVYVHGQIVDARGFDTKHLYVKYFVELPGGWYAREGSYLGGITHSCRVLYEVTEGKETSVATFCFPIEFSLVSEQESEDEPPRIFVEIDSYDGKDRNTIHGYGYTYLPRNPGHHNIEVHVWNPTHDLRSRIKSWHIGGTREIYDYRYGAIPQGFEGRALNKYGFETETTGLVRLQLNVLHQTRYVRANQAQNTVKRAQANSQSPPPVQTRPHSRPLLHSAIKQRHTRTAPASATAGNDSSPLATPPTTERGGLQAALEILSRARRRTQQDSGSDSQPMPLHPQLDNKED